MIRVIIKETGKQEKLRCLDYFNGYDITEWLILWFIDDNNTQDFDAKNQDKTTGALVLPQARFNYWQKIYGQIERATIRQFKILLESSSAEEALEFNKRVLSVKSKTIKGYAGKVHKMLNKIQDERDRK